MKAGNKTALTTVRNVLDEISTREKSAKTPVELDDAQVTSLLQKEAAKRRDTARIYTEAGEVIDAVDLGPQQSHMQKWRACPQCGWIETDLGPMYRSPSYCQNEAIVPKAPRMEDVMPEDAGTRQQLSDLIEKRRSSIRPFLQRARPRRDRLTTISVVGSSVTAALTVGPGAGGKKFTESVQALFSLQDSSAVWRILCLAAVLFSLVSAIATSLANSHELAAKVSAAEACSAELDGLEVALSFGHLNLEDAIQLYQQYVAKVPFVDDAPVGSSAGAPGSRIRNDGIAGQNGGTPHH